MLLNRSAELDLYNFLAIQKRITNIYFCILNYVKLIMIYIYPHFIFFFGSAPSFYKLLLNSKGWFESSPDLDPPAKKKTDLALEKILVSRS